jgi:hypothetical protein
LEKEVAKRQKSPKGKKAQGGFGDISYSYRSSTSRVISLIRFIMMLPVELPVIIGI